jgi:NO-binding membrane sensor protein with MHYT domain
MGAACVMIAGLIPLEADPGFMGAPITHDRALVGLSMLVAVAMAYAFVELAARARHHSKLGVRLWNAAAGLAFGLCLFLPHLLGLIALDSALVRGLSVAPTAASGAIALATGCAAFLIAGSRPMLWRIVLASMLVGAGGIAMHYVGMRGLIIDATLTYRPTLIAVTTTGAFVGSVWALSLAHRLEAAWLRAALAFPMGAVAAGLHYTDIAAMVVRARPRFEAPDAGLPESWQAIGVITLALMVLGAVILATAADRDAVRKREETADQDVVIIPSAEGGGEVVVLPERRRS